MFHYQYYFGSNINSYIIYMVRYMCISTQLHNIEALVGCKKLKNEAVVNVSRQENLSTCCYVNACNRSVSPALGLGLSMLWYVLSLKTCINLQFSPF